MSTSFILILHNLPIRTLDIFSVLRLVVFTVADPEGSGGDVRPPLKNKIIKKRERERGGLCPGPAGDLNRSSDPSPTFVPPTQNPGSAPVLL
jgi:hypothetical protein